jgi:hypothetical protein
MTSFDTFTLDVGGVVSDALTFDRTRVLRITHGSTAFVIAHTDGREEALALTAREATEHDDPIYTILLTDDHLDLDDGATLDGDVLDGHNDHQPAGHIKIFNDALVALPTQYGELGCELALTETIEEGDVFTGGDCDEHGNYVVHRALSDYDPETGEITVHVLTPDWATLTDQQRAEHTKQITTGPDHLVDVADDTAELLKRLGVEDIRKFFPDHYFNSMHIGAGGTIHDALTGTPRRVLTATLDDLFFVIAHHDDAEAARTTAAQLVGRHEGTRSIHVVLLTDAHLDAVAAGASLNVAVLDAQDDYRPAPTAIDVTNRSQVTLPTEHGKFLSEIVTTADLRAGDIYTCGVPRLGGDSPALAVYRARADYNPATGWVTHHLVDPGELPAVGEDTGALTDGPDCLVHRIVDRDALLEAVGLTDLVPA